VSDVPLPSDSARSLRLAAEAGACAYDDEYVALAEGLGLRFVTGDGPLARRFEHIAIHPADFAAHT